MLHCPDPSRSEWRSKFIADLRSCVTQIDFDPGLAKVLMDGLRAWLDGHSIQPCPYHPKFSLLISQQSSIGWDQLFLGRFSVRWGTLQDSFQESQSLSSPTATNPKQQTSKPKTGTDWTSSIICSVWKSWHVLWKTRNDARHGADACSRARAKHDAAVVELSLLYSQQSCVLSRDTPLFHQSLSDHSKAPTRSIRQWINTFGPVIRKSIQDARTTDLKNMKPLSSYFLPSTSPPLQAGL